MTTLTYDDLTYLNENAGRILSALPEDVVFDIYSKAKVKSTFNFFFQGEDHLKPRHATVTKAGKIFDYCAKKHFDTLEAWHADVLRDYPLIRLSGLCFGQVGVFMVPADIIENMMGWEHLPLTGKPVPAPAPVPVPAPVPAPAAAPVAGGAEDLAAFEQAVRKQAYAKFSTATSVEEMLAAAEEAGRRMSAKEAEVAAATPAAAGGAGAGAAAGDAFKAAVLEQTYAKLSSATTLESVLALAVEAGQKLAKPPAPARAPGAVEEKDDEDMASLAVSINACHIAADKCRRIQTTTKKAKEEATAAAIIAVGKWLDQRGIFAWAPNVERALEKEMPEAGLGDYLYIAKALLQS